MATLRRTATRVVFQDISRQYNASSTRPAFTIGPVQPAVHTRNRPVIAFHQLRYHSAPSSNSKVYDFGQIKELTEKPSSDRILIDVREPHEYEEGYIPGAINIPIKSQPDAMFLPADEFEDRLGFSKPSQEQEVVFYCKSGVRSSAAANLAQQIGYSNVSEYRGSWMDWQKNGGAASKP
ncbi:uncharacterized protein LTR77_000647 [Saxophila tyrrhenica]|uniref:Rhodanese domain-containing protein n=1 Tax=Saxophila tyrrhenica TaxID=1690608 RepID=A0AAV9PT64_9PEZI|nr:hypothetical protein LTR77_000647 [Saxophila tyrrhenica]